MTALAGLWSFAGATSDAACRRMLAAQAIYGPHGTAQASPAPGIALGRALHRTLPEDRFDRGPIESDDRRFALVADLRIDDRDDLAAALDVDPVIAARSSDAALLLAAVERWGAVATIERLIGDFALALWDAREACLWLARDFLGQRPLHYHRAADGFAFASMPRGLQALDGVGRTANLATTAGFLALLPDGGHDSFHDGIARVPPGHWLRVTADGMQSARHWHPPALVADPVPTDAASALRIRFDAAVGARLRGAGKVVGAHLSAGLDSAAVATAAATILGDGGRVAAYTAVPRQGHERLGGNGIADEGALAAATAAHHANIDHVTVRGGFDPARLDRDFHLYQRPMLNPCNLGWIDAINDAARARGVSVMLTGQLGNMTISHSGLDLLPALLAKGRLIALARLAVALRRGGLRLRTIAATTLAPFVPRPLWRRLNRWRGVAIDLDDYAAIDPAAVVGFAIPDRARAAGLDLSYRPTVDGAATRRWVLERFDPGAYNKGVLAGWGIDCRDPTADRRVVEFCLALPEEEFVRGGVPRGLARRAFAGRIPPAVLEERRRGRQGADWHLAIDEHLDAIAGEIEAAARCPGAATLVDLDRLRREVEGWRRDGPPPRRTVERCRLALLRGVAVAHFLRRTAGTN